MKQLIVWILIFSSFIYCTLFTSCANIVPPSGGPKDSLPPQLIAALPIDSATNVSTSKITLTFNEFVEVKDIQQNLLVSPIPKNQPIVDYKLRTITVKLKDSLQPNTTYSINFGNAIKDITEGNVLNNFTYVFSSGKKIADGSFNGKVLLAKTGKVDSTLIVVLHKNLSDSAILKTTPVYMTKIDAKGTFSFNFIEPGKYNAFVIPNEYNKRYDDSTFLFAFLDSSITISNSTSNQTFYTFRAAEKVDKAKQTTLATKGSEKEDKRFRLLNEGTVVDLISKTLTIGFSKPVKTANINALELLDTLNQVIAGKTIRLDSTKKRLLITANWQAGMPAKLIVPKNAFTDTANNNLPKTDTIKITVKNEFDYGSLKIRFTNIDTSKKQVLLIIKDDEVVDAFSISSKEINRKLYTPGDYEMKILYDLNGNLQWDTGNYFTKKQPEKVAANNWKLQVRPNWDNEVTIALP